MPFVPDDEEKKLLLPIVSALIEKEFKTRRFDSRDVADRFLELMPPPPTFTDDEVTGFRHVIQGVVEFYLATNPEYLDSDPGTSMFLPDGSINPAREEDLIIIKDPKDIPAT